MSKEEQKFKNDVKKAVKDMETFLMFTAMIDSYKEDKHGQDKDGQLFHFA